MPGVTSMRKPNARAVRETRARRLYRADALRRREFGVAAWDNVIEEINDVGNRYSDVWAWCCTSAISHVLTKEHSGSVRSLSRWRKEVKAWRVQMFHKLRDRSGMKGELPEMPAGAWKGGREDAVTALVDRGDPVDWPTGNRLPQSWHLRLPVARLCGAGESEHPCDHGRASVVRSESAPTGRGCRAARPRIRSRRSLCPDPNRRLAVENSATVTVPTPIRLEALASKSVCRRPPRELELPRNSPLLSQSNRRGKGTPYHCACCRGRRLP